MCIRDRAFNETPSVDLSRMKPNEKRELAAAYLKRQESWRIQSLEQLNIKLTQNQYQKWCL